METILVANSKGGCGKTTLATHLAAAFASVGKACVLGDADRQRSSLNWSRMRPASVPRVLGLDWSARRRTAPAGTGRLVVDSPAGTNRRTLESLVRRADLVVAPVLPSIFDEQATARFLALLERLKAIRRHPVPIVLVANRVNPGSHADDRLDIFIRSLGYRSATRIPEHELYGRLAVDGLSLFDLDTPEACDNALHWLPLLGRIEECLREGVA